MNLVRTILLLCFIAAAAYGQHDLVNDGDVTPVLNPLDERHYAVEPVEKVNWRDIGKGLCQVYEFSLNNSVTSDQVATFILNETPVRYRSALYDEFVKGGTQFLSRLANVGCHIHKIRNWFLNHFHRSNNADTMDTLSKPFAGLRDSADIEIMHTAMEYIHAQRSSAEDLHLIPQTMCQVHDLCMERRVSIQRIRTTAENMPAEISHLFLERVLQLGSQDVRKIAVISSVGCKVLPVVVDLDIKNMEEHEDAVVVPTTAVAEHKGLIGTGIGICAVRELVLRANITSEQVAELILTKTPQKFRTKLYEEFVKGGTSFVARVANVGCNMVQMKSVVHKFWPIGRFFHLMITLSKPFGGLAHSDEFMLLHEALEYIERHRGSEGLMVIPDTMCYIRRVSRNHRITKEAVIAEVESKMPQELRKSLVDKILRFGVNSVARLADVACKTLPLHIEVDVSKVGHDDTAHTAVAAYADVEPAAFHLPLVLSQTAFCALHKRLQQRGISHDKVIDFINKIIPKPLRKPVIEKFTKEGVEKLAIAARIGCFVVPRIRKAEEMDLDVEPTGVITDFVRRESFCELMRMGDRMGVTKSGVSQFIRIKFPQQWRKHLLGQLFELGLQAVVDVAHKWCFA